jgi:TonB family protein
MRGRWHSAALVVSLVFTAMAVRSAMAAPAAMCRGLANFRIETTPVQNQFPSGPKIQTFMGRVLSQNDVRFIFRDDASDVWYHLDDQDKAKTFLGKDVVITGTIDGLTGTIRMQSIRLRTAEDRLPDPPSPPEEPSPAIAPASEKSVVNSIPKDNNSRPKEDYSRAKEDEPAPAPVPSRLPTPRSTPPPAAAATSAAAVTPPSPSPAQPLPAQPSPAPSRTPARAEVERDRSKIVVNLPEEAVGASSSVAIISRRSIAVPAGSGAAAGQNGKNVVVGKALVRPVPAYPYEAQQQRVEGTVKVHAVVGTDGTVRSVEPISGPEPLMDAARTAVREWRFAPTKLDGRPVDVQDDVTLFFRLPN